LDDEGLGIDADGRLYWNGKPVEIIGRRLDLTGMQAAVGVLVMLFTGIAAVGSATQGSTAYHDWACKTGRHSFVTCPQVSKPPVDLAPG
jgi:hypothetical protein